MKLNQSLPFTYPWIIRHHLNNLKTVLDVGCGDGSFMNEVNFDRKLKISGVELFAPYLKLAKKTGAYHQLIKKDVRKMMFKSKSYGCVHSSQVIEHLSKKEGLALIRNMEKIAKNRIIIGTPNGHFHQEEYHGNKLQEHHSAWDINSFEKLNYKVYGQGLKIVYGEHGLLNTTKYILGLKYVLFTISILCSPFVYYNPQFAAHIIAVKKV